MAAHFEFPEYAGAFEGTAKERSDGLDHGDGGGGREERRERNRIRNKEKEERNRGGDGE